MTLRHLDFPETQLSAGADIALARAVEAGCYAEHLIATGDRRAGLQEVVAEGRRAQETLFFAAARIALRMLASFNSTEVPREELFQEACLAIGEAIRRFDHRRGTRFTTYVHECISRALHFAAGRLRPGAPESRSDRAAAALLAEAKSSASCRGRTLGMRAAARVAGLSEAAAARASIIQVSLDEVTLTAAAPDARFEAVEPVDFVALLPVEQALVLRARFGFDGPSQSRAQLAQQMEVSVSTIRRLEVRALATARRLLERDQTRITMI